MIHRYFYSFKYSSMARLLRNELLKLTCIVNCAKYALYCSSLDNSFTMSFIMAQMLSLDQWWGLYVCLTYAVITVVRVWQSLNPHCLWNGQLDGWAPLSLSIIFFWYWQVGMTQITWEQSRSYNDHGMTSRSARWLLLFHPVVHELSTISGCQEVLYFFGAFLHGEQLRDLHR